MSVRARLKKVARTKPKKYQIQGIRFIESARGRAIIGDVMGLGKTYQALGWMAIHPKFRPAIIVCPAHAKYEWAYQMKRHFKNLKCQIASGRKPKPIKSEILIINYDILHYWKECLTAISPEIFVMDECHYAKNWRAQRTKACVEVSKHSKYIVPISGTPIQNRPVEFFPVLHMVSPREFPSFWKYAMRYCKPTKFKKAWKFDGADNIEELHGRVSEIMIRRTKEIVASELLRKHRMPLVVRLSNRQEYENAKNNFLEWWRVHRHVKISKGLLKAKSLVRLGQLKKLCAMGKLKSAYNWITDFMDETPDQKLVVFCQHKPVHQKLIDCFGDRVNSAGEYAAIGGGSAKDRHEEVLKFQDDPKCRLYLGSLQADGTAITLTAASTMLILEQGWSPFEMDQVEDRIHRLGQKESVNIYYMLAQNTVDVKTWDLLEVKRDVVNRVLQGKYDPSEKVEIDWEFLVEDMMSSNGGKLPMIDRNIKLI